MGVSYQPENASVGEGCFVEALEEIDRKHDREDCEIDLSEDTLAVFGRDNYCLACMLEEFGSFVFVGELVSTLTFSVWDMIDSFDFLIEGIVIQL
jgi:hypothetical protein